LVALFSLFRAIRNEHFVFSWDMVLFEVIPFIGVASAVYVNLHVLLPRFLTPRRYKTYTVFLLGLTLVNALMVHLLFNIFHLGQAGHHHGPDPNRWMFFPAYMVMQLIFVSITSFFHFVRENSRLNEIALSVKEMESNQLRAELNSLKAQINPHFLFNTLNNIYSYSLFQSKKTPDMILKLSNLMNYIIYECRADQVPLDKELEFIQNYMDLEKLRVEDSLKIDIQLPEESTDLKIAPLLFVPFLENAFKHGANIRKETPYIRLRITMQPSGDLHFECENLRDEDHGEDSGGKSGGIGLENVRKRLELIYPQRHKLQINRQADSYRVNLTIQLEEERS